ncbi:flagellar hook-basal body complex protein FliE [Roseiconus lacunae]|uniref:Flagellar hook-basal body complex protein FliE n=1 Tax=Roseiconus lacunae TaxID=2605694 RepID=A0ABT7PDD6_9BACT|nr:flagellar hook-basal body complex protein FliE [Roseiconus lacunae]MCD0459819.1 flagellar hook-basal body complex protein FliE [Roseiconus lacunae]MDM4014517.1 flagellar hook-basal body complex protein FliE [Roseiconus lacunae]WRQ49830.1 flagellar hook-basal body complex protein FliE [Stieleria sp. HD01]
MSALPPVASVNVQSPGFSKPAQAINATPPSEQGGDRNIFLDLMAQANDDQLRSEQAIDSLVSGKTEDVQQVVMEVVKAEMSFQVFMEVRNQIIESYDELMRMQF